MATVVEVIWHDAHADTTSWIGVDDIGCDPCVVMSVGILLPDAKPDHIVLVQSQNSFDQLDCVLSIPVAMVKSMRAVFAGGLDVG
tara:strand:- start:1899 stop:2153 length:255 start_codon:yes stop_codon:yes gene_type:complete